MRAGSCGLRVLPGVKTASSVVTVLPRMIGAGLAQALHNRGVAATDGVRCRRGVPFSVGKSRVSMMSFSADRHAMQRPGRAAGARDSGRRLPPAA